MCGCVSGGGVPRVRGVGVLFGCARLGSAMCIISFLKSFFSTNFHGGEGISEIRLKGCHLFRKVEIN